jgi:glycosyltransferase involved in cell wall biosynthesis
LNDTVQKPQIVLVLARSRPSGISDYTRRLAEQLRAQGEDVKIVSDLDWKNVSREEVSARIRAELPPGDTRQQIVHLQYLYRSWGPSAQTSFLRDFPGSIVTCHEFEKESPDAKEIIVPILQSAGKVVFSTAGELKSAERFLQTSNRHQVAAQLQKKAQIVPIFSNIPVVASPEEFNTNNDIVHFGRIRKHEKGLEQVIELARELQKRPQPQAKAAKIHIAGNVMPAGFKDFKYFVAQIYKLDEVGQQALAEANDTAAVLELVKDQPKQLPNVELHVGQPADFISHLLAHSRFAYLPFARGATEHSGTLPAVLEHDCICFTTKGPETHGDLKRATVITQSAQDTADKYIDYVCHPSKERAKCEKIDEYMARKTVKAVAKTHGDIYTAMSKSLGQGAHVSAVLHSNLIPGELQ